MEADGEHQPAPQVAAQASIATTDQVCCFALFSIAGTSGTFYWLCGPALLLLPVILSGTLSIR